MNHMTRIDLHAHFRRVRPKLHTVQFWFFLLTSVRDDFNVRDYSRQDLFIEAGYESELITTINLINSEKGFKNSFWIKLIFWSNQKKRNFTQSENSSFTNKIIYWSIHTTKHRGKLSIRPKVWLARQIIYIWVISVRRTRTLHIGTEALFLKKG